MTTTDHGTVIPYPYLWKWQERRGETEGRRARPCCMIYSFHDAASGQTHLFLLAISSQPPRGDQTALAIPDLERRRAGLADWKGAWITVSEYNHDIAEASFYLEPNAKPFGRFSATFTKTVAVAFRAAITQADAAGRVDGRSRDARAFAPIPDPATPSLPKGAAKRRQTTCTPSASLGWG